MIYMHEHLCEQDCDKINGMITVTVKHGPLFGPSMTASDQEGALKEDGVDIVLTSTNAKVWKNLSVRAILLYRPLCVPFWM